MFRDLAPEDDEDDDEEAQSEGVMENQWLLRMASPSAADSLPHGLISREPIEEHSCGGICCSEGFQDAEMLRRRKKRQWRKMNNFDVHFGVCLVEVEDKKVMCLDSARGLLRKGIMLCLDRISSIVTF